MKKLLLIATAAILSIPAIPSALAQHIYVQVGPPAPLVEHPGPRPHEGWVWVAGYHRWDGHGYVWIPAIGSLRRASTPFGFPAIGAMKLAAGTGWRVIGGDSGALRTGPAGRG
jgi:hypothetical protein